MASALPSGLALGAGLSGFAQGFASSFLTAQERKWQETTEKNKTAREMLIKGALDPHSPADPNDPGVLKVAGELLGEQNVPMFQSLLKKNIDYVYATRAQEHEAATRELAPGEQVSYKTPSGITETRKGPPQPKAGASLGDVEATAAARARGTESVRGPAREAAAKAGEERTARRETRAEARKQRADVRAERRQFRDEVRKTAIKLRTDPKARGWSQALHDWLRGADPDQRLGTALAGIPPEALPPSLQAKQQEAGSGAVTPPGQVLSGTTSGRVSWKKVSE